ncbi:LTA synthase family protein [Bifidobacterium longum]|uniref:LTA synthase family protein n=1 Tax=Bifidobacterium longum subsp. longum TaxID=1679 RepID=A0A9Q8VIU8_BIFLL|nr:LTA synthase family protein [Bifidobacterium longum]UNL66001.1 LTA synthase family protein [Bifidobacterium longum subsp. longum]UNL67814.1 LTA synthase family protein [Bifidobacterium longum subsp. longum]UNL69850.1 LTA synthase family protein [Bifidobacterium longum subsp. longum]UNL71230.1 LTA synthase family protein [Bifidobacterium longum subsp. longum]UNL82200.1 LTA synthase family protein [Bifidobacterium longum subsp. longum]
MSENTSSITTVKPHFKLWAKKAEANEVTPQHPHKPFPGWVYGVLFVIFDIIVVTALEVGVSSSSTRVQLSSPTVGFGFVSKMWTDGNFVFVLNVILVALLYLMLLMLFNRFWTASIVILAVGIIVAAIEHFKVEIRYEAILPADLGFLGSNTGNMLTFIPAGAHVTILVALGAFAVLLALILVLRHFDGRKGRMIRTDNLSLNLTSRLILLLLPILVFALYCIHVSTTDSLANKFSRALGDTPSMWDSVYDAQRNGPLVAFTRQLNPKIMDKPSNYSEETMKKVAARYQKEAETINASRTNNLTDSTVVYVLSESFSDPSRVPGLKTNKDSMPNIRKIKAGTTSGLMLSSGYGGGTANLEYMGLSGLSMANFDSSLSSPYQQLVPSQHWTPTINQMWGAPANSLGYHPYESSMYSRATNYKKFGFSHFYTLTGPDVIKYQDKIDESPYVSDKSSYDSALEGIRSGKTNKFIQIITMQNHMPYHEWYENNDYTAESTTGTPLGDDEQQSIETYQKGVEITDQATQEFLNELDALDKPVTVVFYGDHLPGIYSSASEDDNNSLALHLTDYFIWSNKASSSQGNKASDAAYSSPNFFVAQAADHMNAKVSPYLAFLTEMHSKIAAMEPPVVNKIQGWDRIPEGQNIYLDQNGNPMSTDDFDKETKQLLADYKLIQYDITAGKNYLKDTDFMTLP